LKVSGMLLEQLGEHALERGAAGLSLLGLAAEVTGVYLAGYHSLVAAQDARVQGGLLQGTYNALSAVDQLDRSGELGEGDAGSFDKKFRERADKMRQWDADKERSWDRGAFDKEGGASGELQRMHGWQKGVDGVLDAMKRVQDHYQDVREDLRRTPTSLEAHVHDVRRQAWAAQGIFFKNPNEDLAVLRRAVFQTILAGVRSDLAESQKKLR